MCEGHNQTWMWALSCCCHLHNINSQLTTGRLFVGQYGNQPQQETSSDITGDIMLVTSLLSSHVSFRPVAVILNNGRNSSLLEPEGHLSILLLNFTGARCYGVPCDCCCDGCSDA
jgi:hypothetical protein